MAEIHVQTKKHSSGSAWIWILLVVLIAAGVVYYLMTRNKAADNNAAKQPDAALQMKQQTYPQPIQAQPVIPIVYSQSL